MKKAANLILSVFLLCIAVSPAAAEKIPYEWTGVERIVAIGDVHGAYENFVAILKNANLIDEHLRWIGGKTHLVQVGDVVDRGARSRECMDLLMKLEKEAEKKGGRVHALIGNHEVMNVVGILDHTSPEEFASYRNKQSSGIRKRGFEVYLEQQKLKAKQAKTPLPPREELKRTFDVEYPPGFFGHRVAFEPKGRYGKWILGHNVAVRLNDIVFSHGDWSEEISALGIEGVNQRVRDELSGKSPLEEGITFNLKSPLQNRGLATVLLTRQQQEAHREAVDQILANLGAKRMVVGHTATDGVIEPRFGGKHISIDVGMLELYRGGHRVALEIEGDTLRALHPGGAVPLPDYLDETTTFDYLVAVAAVDRENVNVHERLVAAYQARGDLQGARYAIEQLFRINKSPAFRYRRMLGDIYRKLGDQVKAREQYTLFIEEMQELIRNTPHNPELKNVLARFCLDHDLKLDLAEESIRDALRGEPGNPGFLLTSARLQFALSHHQEAIQTLERLVEMGKAGYEAYYVLGLSHLELKDTPGARRYLEIAIQKNPEGREARDALRKLGESGNSPQGERKEP